MQEGQKPGFSDFIAGTRITFELILEKLAAGESIGRVLEAHPRLTREAILAALAVITPGAMRIRRWNA